MEGWTYIFVHMREDSVYTYSHSPIPPKSFKISVPCISSTLVKMAAS